MKKEFSAENIYFWVASERYKQINDLSDRIAEAKNIFEEYLADNAREPVNVDSKARTIAAEKLNLGEVDLFEPAQKQIFNLMKFDSYQRFIKSNLYKNFVEAEKKNTNNVPYIVDPKLSLFTNKPSTPNTKLKKSYSNVEDKRKKSVLPWQRKKSDSGLLSETANSDSRKKQVPKNSSSDMHGSKNSLTSFSTIESFKENTIDPNKVLQNMTKIYFGDDSTTVVEVKDESIDVFIRKVLEKRGLKYSHFEVLQYSTTNKVNIILLVFNQLLF